MFFFLVLEQKYQLSMGRQQSGRGRQDQHRGMPNRSHNSENRGFGSHKSRNRRESHSSQWARKSREARDSRRNQARSGHSNLKITLTELPNNCGYVRQLHESADIRSDLIKLENGELIEVDKPPTPVPLEPRTTGWDRGNFMDLTPQYEDDEFFGFEDIASPVPVSVPAVIPEIVVRPTTGSIEVAMVTKLEDGEIVELDETEMGPDPVVTQCTVLRDPCIKLEEVVPASKFLTKKNNIIVDRSVVDLTEDNGRSCVEEIVAATSARRSLKQELDSVFQQTLTPLMLDLNVAVEPDEEQDTEVGDHQFTKEVIRQPGQAPEEFQVGHLAEKLEIDRVVLSEVVLQSATQSEEGLTKVPPSQSTSEVGEDLPQVALLTASELEPEPVLELEPESELELGSVVIEEPTNNSSRVEATILGGEVDLELYLWEETQASNIDGEILEETRETAQIPVQFVFCWFVLLFAVSPFMFNNTLYYVGQRSK